jgi:hypothetical protein
MTITNTNLKHGCAIIQTSSNDSEIIIGKKRFKGKNSEINDGKIYIDGVFKGYVE